MITVHPSWHEELLGLVEDGDWKSFPSQLMETGVVCVLLHAVAADGMHGARAGQSKRGMIFLVQPPKSPQHSCHVSDLLWIWGLPSSCFASWP